MAGSALTRVTEVVTRNPTGVFESNAPGVVPHLLDEVCDSGHRTQCGGTNSDTTTIMGPARAVGKRGLRARWRPTPRHRAVPSVSCWKIDSGSDLPSQAWGRPAYPRWEKKLAKPKMLVRFAAYPRWEKKLAKPKMLVCFSTP